MNERLMELYDQAIILESNGDYEAGELDPFKFAKLIVRETVLECINTIYSKAASLNGEWGEDYDEGCRYSAEVIKQHFGVEE